MILKIIKKNRLLININSYICIRKQLSYKQKKQNNMENSKSIHSINTFASTIENETIILGKDQNGDDLRLVLRTVELLEWLDIDYMKRQAKIYINNL